MKKYISVILALMLSSNVISASAGVNSAENTEEKYVYGDGHFESIISGDINSDGVLNAEDVIKFLKWLTGTSKGDFSGYTKADFNSDGKVNIVDFCLLKSKIIGESEIVPPAPVSPLTQPLNVKDMDELVNLLKNYDINDYYSGYQESLSDMFEKFNSYGYFYHFSQYENSENLIELSDVDSPVWLLPRSRYEDAGISYNVMFKGKRYQITYYFTDSEFKELSMEEYLEKRFGRRHDGEKYSGYVFSKFKCGDEYNPVADCMLGSDHYCEVRSYDTEEDLLDILRILKQELKLIYNPLIYINEEAGEDEGYIWHLITEDGSCYSAGYVMFGPGATEEDVIQYIIGAGKKKTLVQDEEAAKLFAETLANADKFTDYGWKSMMYSKTVYSNCSFSVFCNDTDGNLKTKSFCSIYDGKATWCKNEVLQNFVKYMITSGYIRADEFWNCTESEPAKLINIEDLSVKIESAPPCMDCFYEDDEYIYYFDEWKSGAVICTFSDGTEMILADAITFEKITLSDLDEYGIHYLKDAK